MAGVSWITVHGRTVRQRGEPANWDAIKLVLNSDFYLKNVDPFDFKWSQAFLPNISNNAYGRQKTRFIAHVSK